MANEGPDDPSSAWTKLIADIRTALNRPGADTSLLLSTINTQQEGSRSREG
jgi:hypothetical protein